MKHILLVLTAITFCSTAHASERHPAALEGVVITCQPMDNRQSAVKVTFIDLKESTVSSGSWYLADVTLGNSAPTAYYFYVERLLTYPRRAAGLMMEAAGFHKLVLEDITYSNDSQIPVGFRSTMQFRRSNGLLQTFSCQYES